MKVIAIHVWVRTKRNDERKRIVLTPESQDITTMKKQIAETLKPLMKRIKYYYVIVVVRKPNRKYGYRVVVPKQVAA
jgi:hypothetical protein